MRKKAATPSKTVTPAELATLEVTGAKAMLITLALLNGLTPYGMAPHYIVKALCNKRGIKYAKVAAHKEALTREALMYTPMEGEHTQPMQSPTPAAPTVTSWEGVTTTC